MTEIRAAQYAVQAEWRRTLSRIGEVERGVRNARTELANAVADLARLRDIQTQLEAHAAEHGWELTPPTPTNFQSMSSTS